ncbi:MAG: peptide ABC transporter ATP-binding protein [Thermoprotei archaeon]|nr:MAG: peptide ABC transporter ATP-binding protein [Thermoprotei archaeon]
MVQPLVKVEHVAIEFRSGRFLSRRRVRVLDDINVEIYEGETFGLVGESGSGKTTLGKTIVGLYRPAEGRVLYRGKDIWSMSKEEFREFRKQVQMIHQDPYASLNPVHTIFRILSKPLLKYKLATPDDVEEKVAQLLKRVGLTPPEDFMYKYPHQLSGGQRQRVSIARAIAVRPKMLVADEPVSMVDVSLRVGILKLLARLREELGMSLLYITHDLATLRYIAKGGRIAVMYLGKIVEIASVEELIEKPLHPYTQLLLAALPEPDPKVTRSKKLPKLRSIDIPSIANPPPGCRFNTRCPYYKAGLCDREPPPMIEVEKGHWVACWLYAKR